MLANKKCIVNAEVFRIILDIYPRVEGVDFIDVPDDDIALAFLIDLGYKGPLYKHTNMFVDHMHQPWRTLAAIINKCLFGKTASEYYQEYGLPIPETMLTNEIKQFESYQMFIKYSTGQIRPKKSKGKGSQGKNIVDNSQETVDVSKESKPEPKPAKQKTSSKRKVKKKVTMSADDNIISNDPDVALELAKSISQTKVEEAEVARKVHATHARIMTESVLKSAKKKSGGRSSKSVVIQDTPSATKSKLATSNTKLKGTGGSNEGTGSKPEVLDESIVIFSTSNEGDGIKLWFLDEEKDIIEEKSKNTSKRQPGTGGSNEGTGSKPEVLDESTVIFSTSNEGDGIKLWFLDEEKDIIEEKDDKVGDADDEGDDHISDTQDADDEDVKTESDEDDIYKYKIRVCKDEDEEMINAECDVSDKDNEEVINAAKAYAEKTLKAKDDPKKTELPPSSSSLSVSLGFGDQFLKLSSNSLLSLSMLSVHVSMISESTVPTPVHESPSTTTATTLPSPFVSTKSSVPQQTTTPILTPIITTNDPFITTAVLESNALIVVKIRVAILEKDVSKLKNVDHSTEALAIIKSQVLNVDDN
nr:hypothetical protein [Tanacetum cinerariifolium]